MLFECLVVVQHAIECASRMFSRTISDGLESSSGDGQVNVTRDVETGDFVFVIKLNKFELLSAYKYYFQKYLLLLQGDLPSTST